MDSCFAMTILRAAVTTCAGELASVAWTVIGNVPFVVGVPVILPELLSVRPPGSRPAASAQVTGTMPPLDVRVALYADPTRPLGRDVVRTCTGLAIRMVRLSEETR